MATNNVYIDQNYNGQKLDNAVIGSITPQNGTFIGLNSDFAISKFGCFDNIGFFGFSAVGTNVKAENISFFPGTSTGNALGGDSLFGSSNAGGSGSASQTRSTKMVLKGRGALLLGTTTDNATDLLQVNGTGNFSGILKAASGTTSSSITTGALVVTGGLGVSRQIFSESVRTTSVSVPGTRQTVLSGAVDSNGFPNALSIGTGLSVTLAASTVSFSIAFAAGFVSTGSIDWIGTYTSNQSFAALTANTTCYLWVDRNTSTAALTTGFSTLQPVYSTVAPGSPATDQHWFDLSTFAMKRWSGSAFVVVQRVFIGEAITAASTVTNIITYAYQRFYQSTWIAVVANTNYAFNHNLGTPIASANAAIDVFSSDSGTDNTGLIATPFVSVAGLDYGYITLFSSNAIVRNSLTVNTKGLPVLAANNTYQSTGFYKLTVKGNW